MKYFKCENCDGDKCFVSSTDNHLTDVYSCIYDRMLISDFQEITNEQFLKENGR